MGTGGDSGSLDWYSRRALVVGVLYELSSSTSTPVLVAGADTNRMFCEDKPPVLLQIDKREATEAVSPLLF